MGHRSQQTMNYNRSSVLFSSEKQWGRASFIPTKAHGGVFIHHLLVFIQQWWWHLSTNALPESGFQGALIPRTCGLPCMQSSGRQSQMSTVSNFWCLDVNAKKIWVGCLYVYYSILLRKNRNFLSCLKKHCLPFQLHSSTFFLSSIGT